MKIVDLMKESGVAFGTSGARGLADKITDLVAFSYTTGFLQYAERSGQIGQKTIAVGGDLRPSTGRIMAACMAAAAKMGYEVINVGRIPSPAVALYGINHKIPTVMVTGSHIPADRNGIKFTTPKGEITKADEQGMLSEDVSITGFDPSGALLEPPLDYPEDNSARADYIARFTNLFPHNFLTGKKVAIYQQSAVGRDIMVEIYKALGADVIPLGRSESFIPVDTEAIRAEDFELAANWAKSEHFDVIFSTDGDSDRPLVGDENGKWFRGDVLGILTSEFLGADAVVTPVSCNSALESAGFAKTYRTRIGSPYVIAGMEEAIKDGYKRVVGYEANGGFLQQSDLELSYGVFPALPTRDPIVVHLAALALSIQKGMPISKIASHLPARFTASDRLKEFPTARSKEILSELSVESAGHYQKFEQLFSGLSGEVKATNFTDGMRVTFKNGEILHFRPSGNAPEFRCYTEADSEGRAKSLLEDALGILAKLR